MRLPWERKYFKICFYAVVTFGTCYVLKLSIDALLHVFIHLGDVLAGISAFFLRLCSLLAPLLIGLVIAYVLDPLTEFLQRWALSIRGIRQAATARRTAGAALVYLLIIGCLSIPVFLLTKKLGNGGGFLAMFAAQVVQAAVDVREFYHVLHLKLMEWGVPLYVSDTLAVFVDSLSTLMSQTGDRLVSSVASAGTHAANFIMGVIIAFYLLRDKHRVLCQTARLSELLLPDKLYQTLRTAVSDVNAVFSGYIRGQLTDAVIMAALIGLWLTFLRVPFAAPIGILTGFSNIIPYFGALIGFGLSILASLLGGEPLKALYAGVGILVLQQIDAMYIMPKVVGKRVELGPIVVLLALGAAAKLFGIVGMIMAVPLCAVLKIFITRWIERQNSIAKTR